MCTIKCGLSLKYKMLPALLQERGFKTHALGKVLPHHSNAQLCMFARLRNGTCYLLLATLTLRDVSSTVAPRLFQKGIHSDLSRLRHLLRQLHQQRPLHSR